MVKWLGNSPIYAEGPYQLYNVCAVHSDFVHRCISPGTLLLYIANIAQFWHMNCMFSAS